MMAKKNGATSHSTSLNILDFPLVEELSDDAAAVISGGAPIDKADLKVDFDLTGSLLAPAWPYTFTVGLDVAGGFPNLLGLVGGLLG